MSSNNINNTKYGTESLNNNQGNNNSAFGAYAGIFQIDACNNTIVGSNASFYTNIGSNNTSVGAGSMCNNTIGNLNTAVGSSALEGELGSNVGNQNTAIGVQALYRNNASNQNTAVGSYSMIDNKSGYGNTALGIYSLVSSVEGHENTCVGKLSGNNIRYGYHNSSLGFNTYFNDSSSNIIYNSTAIGANALCTQKNQITLGGIDLTDKSFPTVFVPGQLYVENNVDVGSLGVTGTTTTYGIIYANGGITGATGSFTSLAISGEIIIDGDLEVSGTTTTTGIINANGGITGNTGSFTYLDASNDVNIIGTTTTTGIINANGGITGNTGSFTYLDASNDVNISGTTTTTGIINANGGITGKTGSFTYLNASNNVDITGTTTTTGIINANGGITGNTGSFTYLITSEDNYIKGSLTVDEGIKANGGITGGTGSFTYLDASKEVKITGNLGITGNVNITGSSLFNGDVFVNNSNTFTATTMILDGGIVNSSPDSVVPKSYVDVSSQGLRPKGPCGTAAANKATITGPSGTIDVLGTQWLATNPYIIDGYTTTGDTGGTDLNRVLINNQNDSVNNGIWVITPTGPSGSNMYWERSLAMPDGSDAQGAYTLIRFGTVNGQSAWVQYNGNTGPQYVGATGLNFVEFSNFNYSLGYGLTGRSAGGENYIDVDNQLTFINRLDSYQGGGQGASGTMIIGEQTTNLSIQTDSLTNNYVKMPSGITGSTGSFNYIKASNDVSISGTTTTTGIISANGGISGKTGSFTYLAASNNVSISGTTTTTGIIHANGGVTGTTGSFQYLKGSLNGNASTASSLAGGAASYIPYQSDANKTSFILNGTSGQVLTSNGTSAPSWETISSGTQNLSQVLITGNSAGSTGINMNGQDITDVGTINVTSDRRIKENIKKLDNTYVVDKLNPVTYLNIMTQQQDIGLIADELQEQYPNLVKGEKDDKTYQNVNYIGLIPILIKEIRELKERVNVLESINKT